ASERQGHSKPGPERADEPDRERDAAAFQRMELVAQLVADHGYASERGVQHVVPQRGIALEHEPEDGDEREQQREQREERIEGDQCRKAGAAVVGELLEHPYREAADGMPALPGVNRSDGAAPRSSIGS